MKNLFIGLLTVFVLILACSAGPAQDDGATAPDQSPLRIVYSPLGGKEATLEKYKPFSDHIEKSLKRPVEAISFDTHEEVFFLIAAGKFDIAYLAPLPYVEASAKTKLETFAMEHYTKDKTGYYSIIITKAKPEKQHEGIVLAFANPHSTSGYLVPQLYFLSVLKMAPEVMAKEVVFAGDHKAVIKGVYEGAYDMGATNNVDLEEMIRTKEVPKNAFTVIWTSEIIPGSPVCVRPDLPDELKKQIMDAVFELNGNSEALTHMNMSGYSKATDKNYDMMRSLNQLFKK